MSSNRSDGDGGTNQNQNQNQNATSTHRFQDRRQQRMRGAGTQQPVARTFSFKPMGASSASTTSNAPPTAAAASTSSNPKPINPAASSSSNPSLSSSSRRSSSNMVLARPSWGGKVGSGVPPASSPPNQDTDGDESISSSGRGMRPAPTQSRPTIRSAVEEASIQPQPTPKASSSNKIDSSSAFKNSSSNLLRSAMRGGRASHAAQDTSRIDSSSPSKPSGSRRPTGHPSNSTPVSTGQQPDRKRARISDVFQRKEISDYGSEEDDDTDVDQEIPNQVSDRIQGEDKGKGKAVASSPAIKSSKSSEPGKKKAQATSTTSTTATTNATPKVFNQKKAQPQVKNAEKSRPVSKEKENKKVKSSTQSKLPFAKPKPPTQKPSQAKTKQTSSASSSSAASTSRKTSNEEDDDDYADDSIQSLSSRPSTSRTNNSSYTSLAELRRGISNAQRRAMAKRLRRVVSLGLEREEEEIDGDDDEAEKQFIREVREDGNNNREWISKEEKKWKGKLNDADVIWSVVEKGLKEAGASTPTSSSITFFRSLRHSLHSKFTRLSSLSSTRSSLINQLKRARKLKRERRKKVWQTREKVLQLERKREEEKMKEMEKNRREEDIKFANSFLKKLQDGAREWA